MKEIVEILFSDGLLKIVFATTTFAIGLNMPARSVLFTKVFKFNGGEGEELVETSEYLQMAGRAGRRGKDKTGTCLICLDRNFGRNIPTVEDFERLLENKGTPLESKLKLSYSMAMNVVKQESMLIDDVLKSSWYESEQEKERQNLQKNAQVFNKIVLKASKIDCPFGCSEDMVNMYTEFYNEVTKRNRNIMTISGHKDVLPLCVVESMAPHLFGEKVVVLKGLQKNDNDDCLYCLFIKDGYKPLPRYLD